MDEKIKIHVINWCTYNDGNVYNGSILCHSEEEALIKMSELYEESKSHFKSLVSDEYNEDDQYYFVMGPIGHQWERAEISVELF